VELRAAPSVRVGQSAVEVMALARQWGDRFVLLVDEVERPLGWVDAEDLPADGHVREPNADATSPLLDRRTTLKDATSLLLDEEVRSGIVVDRAGRVLGVLTLDAVMDWMRDDRSRDVPSDIAEAVAEAVTAPAEEHDQPDAL